MINMDSLLKKIHELVDIILLPGPDRRPIVKLALEVKDLLEKFEEPKIYE